LQAVSKKPKLWRKEAGSTQAMIGEYGTEEFGQQPLFFSWLFGKT